MHEMEQNRKVPNVCVIAGISLPLKQKKGKGLTRTRKGINDVAETGWDS